jgi:tRNA(Arg) A34 adenosine deaminase TadA
MMKFPEIIIQLPDWAKKFLENLPMKFNHPEDKMSFVVDLGRQNIAHQSGGPFGAAVFDEKGTLIAPGVNLVVSTNCSIFHAEIVALAMAQRILGRYDLSDDGKMRYELVTAVEPCAMCFGAIHWSGISRLMCGARDEDARAIGFDEGPKINDWINALNNRGIAVERDVLRKDAIAVLKEYAEKGGIIYNPGRRIITP